MIRIGTGLTLLWMRSLGWMVQDKLRARRLRIDRRTCGCPCGAWEDQ